MNPNKNLARLGFVIGVIGLVILVISFVIIIIGGENSIRIVTVPAIIGGIAGFGGAVLSDIFAPKTKR